MNRPSQATLSIDLFLAVSLNLHLWVRLKQVNDPNNCPSDEIASTKFDTHTRTHTRSPYLTGACHSVTDIFQLLCDETYNTPWSCE